MKQPDRIPIRSEEEAAHIALQRPGLYILEILHDSWCATLHTGCPERCNRQPDLALVTSFGRPEGGRR